MMADGRRYRQNPTTGGVMSTVKKVLGPPKLVIKEKPAMVGTPTGGVAPKVQTKKAFSAGRAMTDVVSRADRLKAMLDRD